jgi:hypothetical protein
MVIVTCSAGDGVYQREQFLMDPQEFISIDWNSSPFNKVDFTFVWLGCPDVDGCVYSILRR